MGKLSLETLAPSLTVVSLVLTESSHDDILVYEDNWLLKFNVITMTITICQEWQQMEHCQTSGQTDMALDPTIIIASLWDIHKLFK